MRRRIPAPFSAPETYAVGLATWYVLFLWLGIPTLPGWAHVLGAVLYAGLLVGVALSAASLDRRRIRATFLRLGVGFVSGALLASFLVSTTDHGSIKSFMQATFAGKVLVAVVGASLFSGVVVALVTLAGAVNRRRPVRS